ncbi:MAG: AMP-binding protein [Bryobacterales bacterium]|nr:AMP-binding protein [Bryobacterales bacterium]
MSPYAQKPWLAHYRVPHTLPIPSTTILEALESHARSRPQTIAIQYFDRSISYAELDHLAACFASLLAARGVLKGDRVALSLQNNPQFAIAQYGAWKRGAAIVPLSPMYKEEELAYQLSDSGAKVWVGLDSLYAASAGPALERAGVQHVFTTNEHDFAPEAVISGSQAKLPLAETTDLLTALGSAAPDPAHRLRVEPSDLAHIVYTSGTTGKPKGAMGLHRHIAFNANVFRTWMDLTARGAVLGMAPLFHITGLVAHLAVAALAGMPLILFHRFTAAEAIRMARRYGATFSVASITAYIALMHEPALAEGAFLKKCFTGGAAVAPTITEQFEARCGSYIHNTYGLTEVNSPSHSVPYGARAPVHAESGALAIGIPIPNCEAQIVDLTDAGRIVPPGEPGELVLKGPFVFEGYWNKPEATAAAFHDGWFLTGDVVIMDREGWFYIVDRKKDMINASGYKVWPREVEDVLYRHPAVREAAVVGVPDPYRGETVKAFLALRSEATEQEVIAFCRERLATYKVPRQVEFVAEIPKTASGKFLRRQLRAYATKE